jgi:hypothetical protein
MRIEMSGIKKSATIVALEALAFVAADDVELGRFLGLSGLSPDALRASAGSAETQRAVMEYVLGHEPTARAFAEAHGYRPEQLWGAARQLGVQL